MVIVLFASVSMSVCPVGANVALLPWCSSVRLSVCLSGTDVHFNHTVKATYTHVFLLPSSIIHTVHFGMHLSLWLDSPMFWALRHQNMSTYSQPSFSSSTWKRGRVWMCKLGVISQQWLKIEVKLLLSANRKSYMPRRLAQQRMTLSDLEWPFHPHHALSPW